MLSFTLSTDEQGKKLFATVDPLTFEGVLEATDVFKAINSSEYSKFYILEAAVFSLCDDTKLLGSDDQAQALKVLIGEARDAQILIKISDDALSAKLTISAPFAGRPPELDACISLAHRQGIKRGLSKKRISELIEQVKEINPGETVQDVVAKGLPPRKGKNSYIKALVPNALDRVLKPTLDKEGKADMREFGSILCVPANKIVAKRVPPSKGRPGYTVKGKPIKPEAGEFKDVTLGNNTALHPKSNNAIIAQVAGLPKFANGVMNIDDTLQTKGVNIATGNIKYEGAVVVNGDVTESMQIEADGDVTVTGFVESAHIRSGGDIIITEGAMGKMQEEDCQLHAEGSIFIQHAQGLKITAGKNVNIKRQLAYSKVTCKGSVTVGDNTNPMGNVFASEISCYSDFRAGTVGAISGSELLIDFSEGSNLLDARYDALYAQLKVLRNNNFDHEVSLRDLSKKHLPSHLIQKVDYASSILEKEKFLLNWLENAEKEMTQAKIDYEKNAKVTANKELFQGVTIKLNKQQWRSEREHPKSRVVLHEAKWLYDPLV